MDGVRVGFLKNMTKLPFNLAGFVLNSREIQDMPDKLESSDVEDEGAYVGGKMTSDVVTTVLGIIGIVSGVGQVVTGLAGDVGGGALCASGVGIPAGVAVVAGSTTLVVAGAAEVAASASLVYSSVSNLGRDVDELKKAKEKKSDSKVNNEEINAEQSELAGLNPSEDDVFTSGKKIFDDFDINSAYVKPKHLSTTGGNGQKFIGASKAEAESILKDVLSNGKIVSISDNGLTKVGNASYEIIIDAGKTVGTRGENLVKIVISSDGGMLSAYPIK